MLIDPGPNLWFGILLFSSYTLSRVLLNPLSNKIIIGAYIPNHKKLIVF